MRTRRLVRHLVPALALATAAGLGPLAVSAQAGGPAAGSPETVTVVLKALHPAALRRLALSDGLSRAQRLRALRGLVPGRAQHASVSSVLAADGFAVRRRTAWTMTAAAPASTVKATFGTRPTLATASLSQAAGALPRLPAALRSTVSAVLPTTGGPAFLHHMTTTALAGPDFRRADTPADIAPSNGQSDHGITVATLQFADFYGGDDNAANDLVSYAAEHGVKNPVANGHYQAVQVDGGPSFADDQGGGDVEVDFDQEAILSTAPSANQHAYFAPNTQAGFADAYAAVYDDVVGNAYATAPDPHIVAVSSSWGNCESAWGASAIDEFEPILESLVAAGATFFAASGDDGIYDCYESSQTDVDFPASSPVVVGVGGTTLSAKRSAPNTGRNWTETAWSCTDQNSCGFFGSGGSGGGESGSAYGSGGDTFPGFPAPSYQAKYIKDPPFAGAPNRLVPDIAADGDPNTGFVLYTSDPAYDGGGNDQLSGGTSLSAPISAAQLANTIGGAGRSVGVGDIHTALYAAYHATHALKPTNSAKVFRDVLHGSNGAAVDKGDDPSVDAQLGYDTTSGLGAVLWSGLLPYLYPPAG
jgi:hypothetical protein